MHAGGVANRVVGSGLARQRAMCRATSDLRRAGRRAGRRAERAPNNVFYSQLLCVQEFLDNHIIFLTKQTFVRFHRMFHKDELPKVVHGYHPILPA